MKRSTVPEVPSDTKLYNLALPATVYADIQAVAERRKTTVAELIRRFIKLGLIVDRLEETPGAALVLREGASEREVLLL